MYAEFSKKEFVNFTNVDAVQLLEMLKNQVKLRSDGSEVSGLLSRKHGHKLRA